MPDRFEIVSKFQYFITCVKLPAGKTPESFMKAIEAVDKKLPGGTRSSRDIREEHSYVTLGRFDLVIVWRGPDARKMGQYVKELFDACGAELGNTETLVVTHIGAG